MDLSLVTKMSKDLTRTIDKNSPTILTALAVTGFLGTVILAVKATPKALEIIHHEAEFRLEQWEGETGEHRDSYPIELMPVLDAIELTWKCYLPSALMGATTIACMIGANHISMRRNAALASLYSIAQTTLIEYQEKVKEELGEKKAEKIQSDIAQDRLDKNPASEKTIILTGRGNYLCFDAFSGRYFRNNIDTLQRIETEFNQRLLQKDYLAINEFYYELGLDPIEMGDEFGWIAERELMHLRFDTKMATVDGVREPCVVMGYSVNPYHI